MVSAQRVREPLARTFPERFHDEVPNNLEALSRVRRLCRSGGARSIRQASGVSLREVADAIGVKANTVQRWEVARRMPRGDHALRYLEQLELLERASAA